jgi:hypothetical protein
LSSSSARRIVSRIADSKGLIVATLGGRDAGRGGGRVASALRDKETERDLGMRREVGREGMVEAKKG